MRVYWRVGAARGHGGAARAPTWHSAQHARQIAAVLESFGIAPDGPLTAQDYAGLPLPDGLWE